MAQFLFEAVFLAVAVAILFPAIVFGAYTLSHDHGLVKTFPEFRQLLIRQLRMRWISTVVVGVLYGAIALIFGHREASGFLLVVFGLALCVAAGFTEVLGFKWKDPKGESANRMRWKAGGFSVPFGIWLLVAGFLEWFLPHLRAMQ